jgi:hypothetical protein
MILYITFLELSRTLLILEFASELPTMAISNLRFKEDIYLNFKNLICFPSEKTNFLPFSIMALIVSYT